MHDWPDFLFLRHGQTDWNVEGKFQGQTDIPLNDTGVAQARNAATILAGHRIDRIISSPLTRALRTATIVAEPRSLAAEVDPQLTERTFGTLEGQVVKVVKQRLGLPPGERIAGHLPPDAEQWPETLSRTRQALASWFDKQPGQQLLFVSHHGLFAALSEMLTGERLEGRNAVPYQFSQIDGAWQVHEIELDQT
ncbi:MAG: histidine phosphatase family protein [Pseudomonadota bacterium]